MNDNVRLSIILPSVGRPSLADTLASLPAAGVAPDDEVLVVADGGSQEAHAMAEASGLADLCRLRVLDLVPQGGAWGHPGRNHGMEHATGTHLTFTQDDNAYAVGALAIVRERVADAPDDLHFFRVQPQCGAIVWQTPGVIACGSIDADCGVMPNDRERWATWGMVYDADWPFWRDVAAQYGEAIHWWDDLISFNQRFRRNG